MTPTSTILSPQCSPRSTSSRTLLSAAHSTRLAMPRRKRGFTASYETSDVPLAFPWTRRHCVVSGGSWDLHCHTDVSSRHASVVRGRQGKKEASLSKKQSFYTSGENQLVGCRRCGGLRRFQVAGELKPRLTKRAFIRS